MIPQKCCSKGWGARCAVAKGKRCRCKCSGENHGGAVAEVKPAPEEEYDDNDDGDHDRRCFHCHGDGWVECDDRIQCTHPHNRFGECPCSSCGGSGNARDMTIW